jgi:hypothetical protein
MCRHESGSARRPSGDRLFLGLGTGDAHLIALDMKTGTPLWDVELANSPSRRWW